MVYLVCGVGQAGGAILDELFAFKNFGRLMRPLAINSTFKDLQSLRHIPRSNWVGLSEAKGLVPGATQGFESLVAGGFGKDPRLADEMLKKNMDALVDYFRGFAQQTTGAQNLVTKKRTMETEEGEWEVEEQNVGSIPFAILMMGMGGGTGCGASALLAKAIREASAVTTNIIVVGILPATHENSKDGARGIYRQAWNTMYALDELEKYVDGFILIDNERLAFTTNVELMFPDFNAYVARAIADLTSAHLLESVNPTEAEGMSLKVIDTRDIASALSFGSGTKRRPGYGSIGWAADTTRGFSGYLLPGLGRRKVDLTALLEVAIRKQSIQGVRPEDAQKNLGLVRLPVSLAKNRRYFPQTGLLEAELGKYTKLKETHFGVTLSRRPMVSVNTLFTYERDQLPRLQQIQNLADKYNEEAVLAL